METKKANCWLCEETNKRHMCDFNNDPSHHKVVQWLLGQTDLIVQITGGNYRLRTLGHSSSAGEKKSDSTLMQE